MSGSSFGKYFRVITFGESHGKAVGVVVDGVKPGIKFDIKDIQKELDKRKPGQSKVVTARKEEDKVEVLSGVFKGKTTGTPICMVVYNKSKDSSKYEKIKEIFRPGHADFTFFKKYGIRDYRGGGRSSGRETIGRVAAGAIAKKELERKSVKIKAYVKEIGGIRAEKMDLKEIDNNPVRCPDKKIARAMEQLILDMKKQGDSVGGVVEVVITGVKPGLGSPVFKKLDSELARAFVSIGAVKGVEFGAGFDIARMLGSEANDIYVKKGGKIVTKTNKSGGIIGGISNGMPIVARIAVKPTASIAKVQDTVDTKGNTRKIKVEGMHDPCICPRMCPVVEAMAALVIYNAYLAQEALKNKKI